MILFRPPCILWIALHSPRGTTMRFGLFIALGLMAVVPFAVPGRDQPAPFVPKLHPRGYVALKAVMPPNIDGKLDDDAWRAAPWSDDFVDIEGDLKPKPRYRTRMKMLWDDRALYIAAELEDPDVWATITEHDAVMFQDPDFEVFLDPDGDNHLYGELEINPKNSTWDLLLTKPYRDGGHAINAWEITGLKTAVAIDGTLNNPKDKDRGWTVEIAWPWASLKELSQRTTPPKDGDQWRANFSHVYWDTEVKDERTVKMKDKPEHNWVWSPQGVVEMHRPERWGYLQFSTQTAGQVKFVPDADADVKDWLHDFYYAQGAYHKKHSKYAGTVADLGGAFAVKTPWGEPTIETTKRGFTATTGEPKRRWSIAQDSQLLRE